MQEKTTLFQCKKFLLDWLVEQMAQQRPFINSKEIAKDIFHFNNGITERKLPSRPMRDNSKELSNSKF